MLKKVLILTGLALVSLVHAQVPDSAAIKLQEAYKLFSQGKDAVAEAYARQAVSIASNNDSILPFAYRLLGTISATHSRKREQIDYLFKSYQSFHEHNNYREEAEALRLIGHYYTQMLLLEDARNYLNKAQALAISQHDTVTQSKVISNLGQVAYHDNNYDQAATDFKRAIALAQSIVFRQGLVENWNRLAYAYDELHRPDDMLTCMKQALRYVSDDPDTTAIVYSDLGLAYMRNDMLDSANYYLQEGLNTIRKGNNKEQQIIILTQLSDLREQQGRLEEALSLLKESVALRKKIYTDQLREEVSYAESKLMGLSISSELRKARDRNRYILTGLIAGIVILIIACIGIFRLRNNNKLIRQQKSELDNALHQLQKSEELYRQLFENSLALILTHTMEGVILNVNKTGTEMLGYKREEFIGRSVREFIDPEYRHIFSQYLQEIRNKKESSGLMTVICADGSKRIIRYQNNVIIDPFGNPNVITFSQDNTNFLMARHQAEQVRNRLSLIMEHSPNVYYILKTDGTITYVNRPDFHPDQDLVGQNVFKVIPSEQVVEMQRQFRTSFTQQKMMQLEEEFNGRTFLIKLIPIIEKDEVHEVLAVTTETTRIKENELELRKLHSIIQRSNIGVTITDVNEKTIWVNEGFRTITGYQEHDIIGRNPGEVLKSPHAEKNIAAFMNGKVLSREPFVCEVLNRYKNGNDYWVKLIAQPIFDHHERFQGYFFIQQDITNEKEMLAQLKAAKEEAEESNRMKTIFMGSLSHEVRTPLQGIIGFAEILENPNIPDAKRRQYLDIIKKRTADLQLIIDSLLDMASLESGEIKSFPALVNLHDLAEDIFASLEQDHLYKVKNISLTLENNLLSQDVALIDPLHVKQVINNLISNAVKFTEEGVVTLHCKRNNNTFLFEVTDTGMGIPASKIEHIFKPFRQAHEGLSRSKGGIGLGLAICKKLVELWGGTITVESTFGRGSTFSFTIPAAK